MVLINKQEKEAVIEMVPGAHFRRTVSKKSHRHHYYLEEDPTVLAALKHVREEFAKNGGKK